MYFVWIINDAHCAWYTADSIDVHEHVLLYQYFTMLISATALVWIKLVYAI